MSASTAHGMGVDFSEGWSPGRRAPRRSPRGWGLVLSLLAHLAIFGSIATVLINRPALREAAPQEAVQMVFVAPPTMPVPEPANEPQVATAFDVAPPAEDAATPAVPVPPPPLVRPPVAKPAARRVVVAPSQEPPVASAPAPEAPFVPARPVAGMESDRPPAYPEVARRRGEQGRVVLKVDVSADGSPLDVSVAQGSGFPVLDAAALGAVRQWRFVPATRGGTPVAAIAQVPIRFRLAN